MEGTKLHDAKYYQEITFAALNQKIEVAAKSGHSKIDVSHIPIGESMIKVLENKGFKVHIRLPYSKTISW